MLLPKRTEEISNNFVVWISSNSNKCDKIFIESRTTSPHVWISELNHKRSLIFTVRIVYNILDITLLKIRIQTWVIILRGLMQVGNNKG
jgi:hypothetical protein